MESAHFESKRLKALHRQIVGAILNMIRPAEII
jgi:hypothetical protein